VKIFSKSMHIYDLYNDFSALCSKRCISETAASMCMCDTPLESLLNGRIGGKFISCIDIISTRRARPTAIAVHLVIVFYMFLWKCFNIIKVAPI